MGFDTLLRQYPKEEFQNECHVPVLKLQLGRNEFSFATCA